LAFGLSPFLINSDASLRAPHDHGNARAAARSAGDCPRGHRCVPRAGLALLAPVETDERLRASTPRCCARSLARARRRSPRRGPV